jgi:hypothetical protein
VAAQEAATDVMRESIDGATCWTLMAAAEGRLGQDWG